MKLRIIILIKQKLNAFAQVKAAHKLVDEIDIRSEGEKSANNKNGKNFP